MIRRLALLFGVLTVGIALYAADKEIQRYKPEHTVKGVEKSVGRDQTVKSPEKMPSGGVEKTTDSNGNPVLLVKSPVLGFDRRKFSAFRRFGAVRLGEKWDTHIDLIDNPDELTAPFDVRRPIDEHQDDAIQFADLLKRNAHDAGTYPIKADGNLVRKGGGPGRGGKQWHWAGTIGVGVDLDAELDQFDGKFDYDDDEFEETRGAFIAWNCDYDARVDGVPGAGDRNALRDCDRDKKRRNDNDLKLFKIRLQDVSRMTGKLVLRRSNGNISVFKRPQSGNPNVLIGVLTHSVQDGESFDAEEEGNGVKEWDLSKSAGRKAVVHIAKHGLFVEGTQPSVSLRDSDLSLEYVPPGNPGPVPKIIDRIKITVVYLKMDYWTSLKDVGRIASTDPLNKIPNPAVVVTTPRTARLPNPMGRFEAKVWSARSAPMTGFKADEWLLWTKERGGFDWHDGKNKGLSVGVVGKTATDAARAGIKLIGKEEPSLIFRFKIRGLKTLRFRCCRLIQNRNVQSEISVEQMKKMISISNIILYQAGYGLVPDKSSNVGQAPPSGTLVPLRDANGRGIDGYWEWNGAKSWFIEIRNAQNSEIVSSVNSRRGTIVFNLANDLHDFNQIVGICHKEFINKGIVQAYTEEDCKTDMAGRGKNDQYAGIVLTKWALRRDNQGRPIFDYGASVLTHELGHGMGLNHRGTNQAPRDGQKYRSGIIPHVVKSSNGRAFDNRGKNVMSYGSAPCDIDLPQVMLMDNARMP